MASEQEDWRLKRQPASYLNFSADSDFGTVPYELTGGPYDTSLTVTVWVRNQSNRGDGNGRVFTTDWSEYWSLQRGGTGSTILFGLRDSTGSNNDTNSYSVTDGLWTFFAGQYDQADGKVRLYVFEKGDQDITLHDEISFPTTEWSNSGKTRWANLMDGSEKSSFHSSQGAVAVGDVDDPRVYHSALTTDEIRSLALGGDVRRGIQAHCPLNEGSGTALNDTAGRKDGKQTDGDWITQASPADQDRRLVDVEATEAFNRYASHFEPVIEDHGGYTEDQYARGQRAILQYSADGGSSWNDKQAGFVQRPADVGKNKTAKVLFVGYDHLLRRQPVYTSFENTSISSILSTVIANNTPVSYVSTNVNVVNDVRVTRDFQGERVDQVIEWLSSSSANERYGVNTDFEFFFRESEKNSAPGNIVQGDWLGYDLPEEGRHAVNSVRVFYGDDTTTARQSVLVEDRQAQQDLADKLGVSSPVVFSKDSHFPNIDNSESARRKGEEILNNEQPALTGSVTTFKRYDWQPGEVFRLKIPEKNIDDDFAIAEINHKWSSADTQVKVAENTGEVTDMLNEMADDIGRVDKRSAFKGGTVTRWLSSSVTAQASISGEIEQEEYQDGVFMAGIPNGDTAGLVSTKTTGTDPQAGFGFKSSTTTTSADTGTVTNTALNAMRNAWQTESVPNFGSDGIRIGTSSATPKRTDTVLNSGIATTGNLTVSKSGTYGFQFEGILQAGGPASDSDISEWGTLDDNGDLHNHLATSTAVTHGRRTRTTFRITVTIDDASSAESVMTDKGQERVANMYIGNNAPGTYGIDERAFGSDGTTPTEGDTSLGSRNGAVSITHEDAGAGLDSGEAAIGTGNSSANGTDILELGDENTSNELMSRIAIPSLSKTSDFEVVTDIRTKFEPLPL